jgi:hypothetical protein
MPYIIKNLDTGNYVLPSGSESSYTAYLQKAQVWQSRSIAESHACGNEIVLSLEDAMDNPPPFRNL